MNQNRVLLVDEPTKGLAPKIVTQVSQALREAAKTVPVLLVEQNLTVVRDLAAGAIVLSDGRVAHTADSATEFLDDEALVTRHLGVGTGAAHEGAPA